MIAWLPSAFQVSVEIMTAQMVHLKVDPVGLLLGFTAPLCMGLMIGGKGNCGTRLSRLILVIIRLFLETSMLSKS